MKINVVALALMLSLPTGVIACPVADTSYTVKLRNTISTKFYFNEDCSEVVQNYDGFISKHKSIMKNGKLHFTERNPRFRWIVSKSGRSIELFGEGWRVSGALVPNKKEP